MVDVTTGLAEPFSVAEVLASVVVPIVVVTGAPGTVKLRTVPKALLVGFSTIAQK